MRRSAKQCATLPPLTVGPDLRGWLVGSPSTSPVQLSATVASWKERTGTSVVGASIEEATAWLPWHEHMRCCLSPYTSPWNMNLSRSQ